MIDRTSNQRQIPVSKAAAHITGNTRVRPVSKLRTIDETAELFSVSKRTVQRLIESWITVGIIAFLIITLVVCGSGLLMHYLS